MDFVHVNKESNKFIGKTQRTVQRGKRQFHKFPLKNVATDRFENN